MEPISVLCYGDSNTWGFNPGKADRFGWNQRWTGLLQQRLGETYRIIEEGLNGRTTVWTDPLAEYRNGKHLITPVLETHKPVDIVVLALGVNDLKAKYCATSYDIGRGVAALLSMIRTSATGPAGKSPEILLVAPAALGRLTELTEPFTGAAEKASRLPEQYRRAAQEFGCRFLDASASVRCSDLDGIHLDADGHRQMAALIEGAIREIRS